VPRAVVRACARRAVACSEASAYSTVERGSHALLIVDDRLVALVLDDVADQDVAPGLERNRELGRVDRDVLDLVDELDALALLVHRAVRRGWQRVRRQVGLEDEELVRVLGTVVRQADVAGRYRIRSRQDGELLDGHVNHAAGGSRPAGGVRPARAASVVVGAACGRREHQGGEHRDDRGSTTVRPLSHGACLSVVSSSERGRHAPARHAKTQVASNLDR